MSDTENIPLHPPGENQEPRYGCPAKKSRCNCVDVLFVVFSNLCLLGCILVITPELHLAWRLGFNNQLVVLGVFMAVMNICTRRIATRFFIHFEVQYGASSLQNLDAILQQSVFSSKMNMGWRAVIAFSIALPIGLSAWYKTFSGGHATRIVTDVSIGQYGAFSRPMENGREQTYSLIDAMAPWRRAAESDDSYPQNMDRPQPYGYNLVTLSNDEVVMLDMPNSTLLGQIQSELDVGETMVLSANISGTLAKYNSSTSELLGDDSFWKSYMDKTTTIETYSGWRVSMALGARPEAWAVVGGFRHLGGEPGKSNDSWVATYTDWESPEVTAFRNSNFSIMFNIYRQKCSVKWNVNVSTVTLDAADCDTSSLRPVDSSMLPTAPDLEDKTFMDALPFAIRQFWQERSSSPWKMPSAAMSVAALHVNRWRHMLPSEAARYPDTKFVREFLYDDVLETFEKTRHTVQAGYLLYFIFAIQPVLATLMLLYIILFLYTTPVDSSFGITSILASVDGDSLRILSGAGLSGELKKRVHLNIKVSETNSLETRIQSTLSDSQTGRQGKIERGKIYN
ncbi:hypothetical protein EDB80DRAFT_776701 [Ilyonectria destructans]|nr:hypothetical protein EDB80DRAFT_776701 [Ilyonectria destructans]